MRWQVAAATANHIHAQVNDELCENFGDGHRLHRIHFLAIYIQRQPRVGNARNRFARVLRQIANRLAHVVGPRRAVHANHIHDRKRFECGQRRGNIGAEQHAPRRIERDLRLNGNADARVLKGAPCAMNGCLCFEDVLLCLNHNEVCAALNQAE